MEKAKHYLTSTTRIGDNIIEVINWTSETNSKDAIEISISKKDKDATTKLARVFLSIADFDKFVSSLDAILQLCGK